MAKRILYCASTASHIINFHLPYLEYFKEHGWQVDVLVGNPTRIPYADNLIVIPLEKSLLAVSNIKAIFLVKELLKQNQYDIISCHTTLAGAVVRMAIKSLRKRSGKVVYTSHGYFFNGRDRLLETFYLMAEKLLASVTDELMVMNHVDYHLAVQHNLCRNITLIPGMGLDLTRFSMLDKKKKIQIKQAAGYKPDDFLIVYAAEMSKRKNHGELIRAFANAVVQEPSMKLLLAGDGALRKDYEKMVNELGLINNIRFLGYVTDMPQLYRMCDLAVSTSRSEGLPFNIMEAMASGLPVVASRIKGHIDLLSNGLQKSYLYDLGNEKILSELLLKICRDERAREKLSYENIHAVQKYSLAKVKPVVLNAYGISDS